jgi:hypothetical protein
MIRTNKYNLPYFVDGDLWSASVDKQRAVALDNILHGLSTIADDGVISGLECTDLGLLNIKVGSGEAFISGFYSRNFSDTFLNLSDNQINYIYAIRDVNEIVDGESAPSNMINISFLDTVAPNAPSNFIATAAPKAVLVEWDENTENDILHYELEGKISSSAVYLDLGTFVPSEAVDNKFSYTNIGLLPLTSYDYRVRVVDTSLNVGLYSSLVVDTLQDLQPPGEVSSLRSFPSDNKISTTWVHSDDILNDLSSYVAIINELDVSGNIVTADEYNVGKALTKEFTGLKNDTLYDISILGIDDYGNVSSGVNTRSTPVSQNGMVDVDNISVDSFNRANPNPVSPEVEINWSTYNFSNFDHYNLYIISSEGVSEPLNVGNTSSRSMSFYAVEKFIGGESYISNISFKDNSEYTVRITSVESNGVESLGMYHKFTIDRFTSPKTVSSLQPTTTDGSVSLKWTRSDSIFFDHYELFVWKNSDVGIQEGINYTNFNSNEIILDSETVFPFYKDGFVELVNRPSSGGTPIPLFFSQDAPIGSMSIFVDKIVPVYYDRAEGTEDMSVFELRLINPPAPIILPDITSYTVDGLDNDEEYSFSLMVVDDIGLRSFALRIVATPAIVVVQPENPVSVTSVSGNSRIDVSWASGGVSDGYSVYRAGPLAFGREDARISQFSLYTIVDDIDQLSISDYVIDEGSKYSYIVVGRLNGVEGELDALDQTVSDAYTVDVVEPPVNLIGSSSDGQIDLSWDSTGDVNIEGWIVYRSNFEHYGFERIVSLPLAITSISDTGLESGVEYFYFVTSFASTMDIVSTVSESAPTDSILLGSVRTEGGVIVSLEKEAPIISGLKSRIEQYTTEFLKRHTHSYDRESFFDTTRVDAIKINLSSNDDIFNLTTEDYATYTSPFDLSNDRSYTAYINGEPTTLYYQIDGTHNLLVFEKAIYNEGEVEGSTEPVVILKIADEREVSGILTQNYIGNIGAELITSGVVPTALLPSISHSGRIKEKALVRTFKMITKDGSSYRLNLSTYVDPDYEATETVDENGLTVYSEPDLVRLKIGEAIVFYSMDRVGNKLVGGSSNGLMQSFDNGITWDKHLSTDTVIKFLHTTELSGDNAFYAIGYNKVYISRDEYQTFQPMGGLGSVSVIHDYAEGLDKSIYLATDVGLLIFDNDDFEGYSFRHANYVENGTISTDMFSVYVTLTGGVVVSNNEGLYATDDKGYTWNTLSTIAPLYSIDRYIDDSLLSINGNGFMYRSIDDGATWSRQLFTVGFNRSDTINIIDDRVYYTKYNGIFYTEDFIDEFRVNGEINSLVPITNVQLMYGTSKNDVLISFENNVYKFYNDELFLWTQFTGISPIIYNNGEVVTRGYYYNSDFNEVSLEYPLEYGQNLHIATMYDSYQLISKGWQDIDEDDVVVEMFIDDEQLFGIVEVTNDDGSVSKVEVTSIKTTDVSEYYESDDDGNIIESTRNKTYVFLYDQFEVHVNSIDGSVVFFTSSNSDTTGTITTTPNFSSFATPTDSNSLNKFNCVEVSVKNVSFINEGDHTHREDEDAFSKFDLGLDYNLGNAYVDSILQMGLSVEHNFLESVNINYPYALTGGVRSFNSELINSDFFIFGRKQYDVFNSTIDYLDVAINDDFVEGAFSINFFEDVYDRTWVFSDSNIHVLDSSRKGIEKQIFIEDNKFLNVTGFFLSNDVIYVVASNNIYKSNDVGDSWVRLNGFGLPDKIYNIIITNNIMAVGTSDAIYYSGIQNEEWIKATFKDSSSNIIPATGDVRYLVSSSLMYAVIDNVLYRSSNSISWDPVTDFNSVSLSYQDDVVLTVSGLYPYKNIIFIGTDRGLYQDNNTLNTLSPSPKYSLVLIDPIDSEVPIRSLSSSGNTIDISADKNYVYKSINSGTSWEKIIVDEVEVIDLVHIWAGIVITDDTIITLSLRSVPNDVLDKLNPIIDVIYADTDTLDISLQLLLTVTEYGNFGSIILEESKKTTAETELASFLDKIYERDSLGEFIFLTSVGNSVILFGKTIDQPVVFSGAIDKVSIYLESNNFSNSNFSVKLSVYGGDLSGNIITGEISSDTKYSSSIYSGSWCNFRIDYDESYDTVILRFEQIGGGIDKSVRWKYSNESDSLNSVIDGIESDFSLTYRLWEFENAVNPIDKLLLSKSAEYAINTPELGGGVFDSTELENDSVVLTADSKILSFIIDQSGSQSWNDHDGSRFDLIKKYAGDLHILYPGELLYTLTTYGGTILSDFIVERVDVDDDRFGKFYRLVRNTNFYPSDPVDGDIIADTTLTAFNDDTVSPGITYFYSLFSIRDSGVYSEVARTTITSNNNIIPLSIGKVDHSTNIIKELVPVKDNSDESSSSNSSSSEEDQLNSSSSSSFNSSSSSESSSSSLSSDSSLTESYTSSSSLSNQNSSSSSEIVFRYRDTGKREVVLEYQPIDSFGNFYNEVRIVRKRINSDDVSFVSNITDGDILYEGSILPAINVFVDDFGGTMEFPNGVTFVYAFFTKNDLGTISSDYPHNYCKAENAVQQTIVIPTAEREWLTDSEVGPTPGFDEIPLDAVNLTTEPGNLQNKITWEHSDGGDEVGYILYVSTSENINVSREDFSSGDNQDSGSTPDEEGNIDLGVLYEGLDTSFVHRDTENDKEYYYKVYSYNNIRSLSLGTSVGKAVSKSDIVDEFEPPKLFDFRSSIINSESILLNWKALLTTVFETAYFDDIYHLKSAAFDKYGAPIDDIDTFEIEIDDTKAVLKQETEAGSHKQPSGGTSVSDDVYAISLDNTTYALEIRAQLELIANVDILNNYTNLNFSMIGSFTIDDVEAIQELEESGEEVVEGDEDNIAFKLTSSTYNADFYHPLKSGVNNNFPERDTVVRPIKTYSEGFGCVDSYERVNGVYIRTGESYFGNVAITYKDVFVDEEDFDNLTVSIEVYDHTRSFWDKDCNETREYSSSRSTTIIAKEYELTDFQNVEVPSDSNTYSYGNIVASGEKSSSDSNVMMTVVNFELLPSDFPKNVMIVATITYGDFIHRAESYVRYNTILNMDVTATAPIADGIDIAKQFASIYLGPPSADSKSEMPRKPARDGIPVKWTLTPKQFGKSDRSFFSSDAVPIDDGIYSLTRDGTASNVFFGPASDVETNICYSDGEPYECGEFYEITATIILDGLVSTVTKDVEITPFGLGGEFRFYMTNGGNVGGDSIWADGEDGSTIRIYADPTNPTLGDGADGLVFADCLESGGFRTVILSNGQEISINGAQPKTLLEIFSELLDTALESGTEGISAEDFDKFKGTDGEGETYEYNGVIYSRPSDIPLIIEDGYAEVIYRVNKFIGPPPCESGSGPAEPPYNDCYGEYTAYSYPPLVIFNGLASSVIDGNSVTMVGGGGQSDGLPPVVTTTLEPLLVEFLYMTYDDGIFATLPNNGITETEVVFEVSFSGEPVPDGSIVKFSLGLGDTSLCAEGGGAENPFAEIDSLPIEERRVILGGFSSSQELIDSVKLVSDSTTTRNVDGKSVVSAFIAPTLISTDISFTLTALSEYDKLGTAKRTMQSDFALIFLGNSKDGGDQGVFTPSVERYDENTGEWTEIDKVILARGGHFTHYNKADGRIYIGAGETYFGTTGTVEQFTYHRSDKEPIEDELSSSSSDTEASSSEPKFGLSWGKWKSMGGRMAHPRSYAQSVIYNGDLVINSSSSSPSSSSSSSSSITSENSSESSSSSNSSSIDHSDSRIYVMGGYGVNLETASQGKSVIPYVEYYDISNDEWVTVSDMPESISHGRAEIYGDYIYVFSGLLKIASVDTDGKTSAPSEEDYNYKIFRYDILNDVWSEVLDLTRFDERIGLQRVSPVSYIVGDKIYVNGGLVGAFTTDEKKNGENNLNVSLVEIDISDDSNILLSDISFPEDIVERFNYGGTYLDDKFYTYGGSGTKNHPLSITVDRYSSYTLSALEIYDSNTSSWETYTSLDRLNIARYAHGAINDNEYCYAVSGIGNGYPANKLFITVTLDPEEMRADGTQSVAVNAEVRKGTGEPPEDGVVVQIRGFIVLPPSLFESDTETVTDTLGLFDNASVSTGSISDVVNSEQSAIERLGNRISLYPVKFSSNAGGILDGSVNFVLFERGEDPLSGLADMLAFATGDDEIIGLVFDENGNIKVPKDKPTLITKGVSRELYSIVVEGTIDDPVYFGQTNTASTVGGSTANTGTTNLTDASFTPQEPSPSLSVYNDLIWYPNTLVDDDVMGYDQFIDVISFVEQDPPFGGSPHWDAVIDNSTDILKIDQLLGIDKIIVDVSDNENNLSSYTMDDALDSLNSIDGYRNTPIFMNAFIVNFPPSLSSRQSISDSDSFELLAKETGGLSHTILDPSFVIPIANRMKTDAVGSIGSGTYIQSVDLGEIVLITDINTDFDIYQFSNAGVYIEYSNDGYNYTLLNRLMEPNVFEEIDLKARFIRFTAFLETTYGNPTTLDPTPPPVFNSISIGYSDPKRQYVYTYPVDTNYPVREMFVSSNSNMIPECSSIKIGLSHSDSFNWEDYASKYQPAADERGRILVVNRSLSTLELSVISEGGSTVDSPKSYDQITSEYILEQQEIFSKSIIKIIVIEENTSNNDGETLLIFEDSTQELVSSAPDYSQASDSSEFSGQNPTFNVTEGTVFNYDFMKTEDSFNYYSTYGPWEQDSLVNVYINNVLTNTSEYIPIPRKGLIRFNAVRNLKDSIALEVVSPARFRLGIEIVNGDHRANVVMDEFAYMFSQDILTGIQRGNVPPSASNLVINPSNPSIYSTFTAEYTYSDIKNQPERNSLLYWYINDNIANELTNKLVWGPDDLVGKRLKDGDRVYYTVQPSDGELLGVNTISSKVVIGVTPPSAENVSFLYIRNLVVVTDPSAATDVFVTYDYVDVQNRTEIGSTVQWMLNGSPVDVGDTYALNIKPGQTGIVQSLDEAGESTILLAKGNTIEAIVTPNNGIVSGATASTGTSIVQNSVPTIQSLTIAPLSPSIASILSFTYFFIDADGDDDSSIYEWYNNGVLIESLNGARTVSSSFLIRGDKWYVKVTPNDGQVSGNPSISATVTIR